MGVKPFNSSSPHEDANANSIISSPSAFAIVFSFIFLNPLLLDITRISVSDTKLGYSVYAFIKEHSATALKIIYIYISGVKEIKKKKT